MSEIKPGDRLLATTAAGAEIEVVADSVVETKGHSFPVVWVRILRNGRAADRIPWPLESVRKIDEGS